MKAPNCPYCDKPLTKVEQYPNEVYEWGDGSYHLDWEDAGEIKCPNCGNDVSELFPDGVINYTSEEGV